MSVPPPYPLVSYRLELNFVHSNTRSRTPTPTLPVVGCNWDRALSLQISFPLNNLDTALI